MPSISAKAHRLGLHRQNVWSNHDTEYLLYNYENKSVDIIIKVLNRNWGAIVAKAMAMGLSRKHLHYSWTKDRDNILKKYYKGGDKKDILSILELNISDWEKVIQHAYKLGLKRDRGYFLWSKKNLEILKRHYPKTRWKNICELLGVDDVQSNRNMIRLKSSRIGLRRKILGQWQSKTDGELLDMFGTVVINLGYIPLASSLSALGLPDSRIYTQRFGCYKEFISDFFGYVENKNIYGRNGRAKDGTFCLSNGEIIVSNFLFANKISYRKEVFYSEIIKNHKTRMRMDWLLCDGTVVEFFGMMSKNYYKKKTNKKIELLARHDIDLIEIYPKDLNEVRLKEIFIDYI